jgi:hypothetical protein
MSRDVPVSGVLGLLEDLFGNVDVDPSAERRLPASALFAPWPRFSRPNVSP